METNKTVLEHRAVLGYAGTPHAWSCRLQRSVSASRDASEKRTTGYLSPCVGNSAKGTELEGAKGKAVEKKITPPHRHIGPKP